MVLSEQAAPARAADDRAAFLARLARTGPVGFGASSLGNLYKPVAEDVARRTVDACWDAGVRYFDTAPFYGFGLSERRLGDALRERDRDAYILSTKVGRLLAPAAAAREKFGFVSPMPFDPIFDYSYDGVIRSVEASLQRLGLARIDIAYMHDLGRLTHGDDHAGTFKDAVEGGFRALADLRDAGVVSAIGLGVNEVEICELSLDHADFDLFMLAGRHTLLDQAALPFLDRCAARGIGIVAAGVFNSGILATGVGDGRPAFYDYEPASDAVIARVAEIERLCTRHDVPLAAAALQFAGAHPAMVTSVVGTANPDRIAETLLLARWPIPPGLWQALRADRLIDPAAPLPDHEPPTPVQEQASGDDRN